MKEKDIEKNIKDFRSILGIIAVDLEAIREHIYSIACSLATIKEHGIGQEKKKPEKDS